MLEKKTVELRDKPLEHERKLTTMTSHSRIEPRLQRRKASALTLRHPYSLDKKDKGKTRVKSGPKLN